MVLWADTRCAIEWTNTAGLSSHPGVSGRESDHSSAPNQEWNAFIHKYQFFAGEYMAYAGKAAAVAGNDGSFIRQAAAVSCNAVRPAPR